MRFTRTRAAVVAGALAVAGTAAGLTLVAPASAGAESTQVVVVNQCNGKGLVRPTGTFDLPGCMPSNDFIGKLSWTSWRLDAFGHGAFELNNCTPSCATGTFVKYPIIVVLWRAKPWPGHTGERYLSRITWIFSGKRPAHVPVTKTMVLPATVP